MKFDKHKYVKLWFELKAQDQSYSSELNNSGWIFVTSGSSKSNETENKNWEQIEYFPQHVENLISENTGGDTVRFEKEHSPAENNEIIPRGIPNYMLTFFATKEKVKSPRI